MGRVLNVVDADGHILEPPDLWLRYIDPAFRDRAPVIKVDTDGKERFSIAGKMLGGPGGLGRAGAVGVPEDRVNQLTYADGRKGGFDPHERIKDLDIDGIDAVVLYPSIGLYSGAIDEPDFAAAVCRAYNRWILDYCSPYPDRLIPAAMLPMQSPEAAVAEMRYARRELNMKSGFLRPNPYNNRLLCDPAYFPIWREAQELDFGIGIHEGNGGMTTVGVDRVVGHPARHIVSHTMEMMLASLNLIWSGVCEQFPSVRFAFLECGGGWMAAWLDRMDRHFERKGVYDEGILSMRPSEYFKRQCWISFEPVEGTIAQAAEQLGPERLLWATDYPHNDGFFPGAPRMIAERLPEKHRQKVLAQGAIDFYRL